MNSKFFRLISSACVVAPLFAAAPVAAAVLDCPLLRGVYTALDADDDMSAEAGVTNAYEITHVASSSDQSDRPWLLRISEGRQKLSYDFAIVHPPGFGGAHLVMMRKGQGVRKSAGANAPTSRLFYFGEDLRRIDPEAEPAPKAPAYVQLPSIAPEFWDWKHDGRRFVPPDGLWKLTACR